MPLVLTRRVGESVMLFDGDELLAEVKVSSISDKQASISISAPDRIKILRDEVYRRGGE